MNKIEEIVGYTFEDISLLETALTHSSFAHKYHLKNNERLEYLGDSILGFVVAEFLYKNFDLNEGELSKIRSKIVSSEHLSDIVSKLELEKHLRTEPNNLIKNTNIKGDFFEALIGAIFIDSNLEKCKAIIYKLLNLTKENIERICENKIDYKTMLQELLQSKNQKFEYRVISEEGKDNEKIFEVELLVENKLISQAKGTSKQRAENKCAEMAYDMLS